MGKKVLWVQEDQRVHDEKDGCPTEEIGAYGEGHKGEPCFRLGPWAVDLAGAGAGADSGLVHALPRAMRETAMGLSAGLKTVCGRPLILLLKRIMLGGHIDVTWGNPPQIHLPNEGRVGRIGKRKDYLGQSLMLELRRKRGRGWLR